MATQATIEMASAMRRALGGIELTPPQARLYSHQLQLDMGRDGLASFGPQDVRFYLEQAFQLITGALIERRNDPDGQWREGMKRGGELLEWLSQPSLCPSDIPVRLLSAAAYQLSGYPALALGQLKRVRDDDITQALLRDFLRADFKNVLSRIRRYWTEFVRAGNDPVSFSADAEMHLLMSIGVICAGLQSGNFFQVEEALSKLSALAKTYAYSSDPYSYVLATLTAEACTSFVRSSIWPHLQRLSQTANPALQAAYHQFGRNAFANQRTLVWPAQTVGINKLLTGESFVLCTATGSGKTTVATLAVIHGLYSMQDETAPAEQANLILYLVPSRALAAEVESKLHQDLKGLALNEAVVTGLYGGIDWGPTDAWISSETPTVLVCTYEKADALIRYLGVLFLNRVKLVVLDEVHSVESREGNLEAEFDASRALRLEQLGARLFRARDIYQFRTIALSAVAAQAAPALARWVSGDPNAAPATSEYRSTRQMLGRLMVGERGTFEIQYDLMNGRKLNFRHQRRDRTPYVKRPFPRLRDDIDFSRPEVSMRAPTLWAALQLAAERPDGSRPSVLISITQRIEVFAGTCATLMENWNAGDLPNYRANVQNDEQWRKCMACAADYFTASSIEYRLLQHGIVMHHGKMPGMLARRLKGVIDKGLARVIIATSTLSEGVNIPVNYLLIPSVFRGMTRFTVQEFSNLMGRAGRPGVATEGSALVMLAPEEYGHRQQDGYEALMAELANQNAAADSAQSALSLLLEELRELWSDLSRAAQRGNFYAWLEATAVDPDEVELDGIEARLDTLDSILIASIEEARELRHKQNLTPVEIEDELTQIWRRTYSFASRDANEKFQAWMARGRVIERLYADPDERRKIYRSSLTPHSASQLISIEGEIHLVLARGDQYTDWTIDQRLEYFEEIIELLSQVKSFRVPPRLENRPTSPPWQTMLQWWLARSSMNAGTQPAPNNISKWFKFVSDNFIYRSAWGLGSIVGLILELSDEDGEPIRALEMDDWPRSGLPWAAFWIKELLTWGTLEPVAAFALARGDAEDRPQAMQVADQYYASLPAGLAANEKLNPRRIRNWMLRQRQRELAETQAGANVFLIPVALERPANQFTFDRISVFGRRVAEQLLWYDYANNLLARSQIPDRWEHSPNGIYELAVGPGRVECS